MFNISSFLDKFSKNINSSELQKKQILEIIEKHTQIKFSPEQVEVKDYVIRVQSTPAILNKIFIYKNKILEDIANSMPVKIIDIR